MRGNTHDYLLAFDLGTTGNKVALIDVDEAAVVDTETTAYGTATMPGGKVEHSPEDWWKSTVAGCRAIAQRRPDAVKKIAAIGCTGMMCGVVVVDSTGQRLRPSIIHADTRSTAQVDSLVSEFGAESIWRPSSNRADCRLSLPKAMWLAELEPDVVKQAASIVQSKNYLTD